ncbi:F-box/kelch-repeat protein At3g06240-like [Cornus florida]|uniref:F-box/kelch-repeat protein At3g06240-like n=1 Tax=Cornus florida TaxID=4283 RepID=UPI00289CEFEF|nr:F-box/kelch-repeat protein At3g06240-like [Cornus florida]
MANLPHDIVLDILSRLPVKSLNRFKCVSKPWLSLISDPYFVKMHLNRANSDPSMNHHRLFTLFPFYSLDYESPSSCDDVDDHAVVADHDHDHDDAIVNLGFPSKSPQNGVQIVGSCNGLISLAYRALDVMILWNPSTRQSRELPKPNFSSDIVSLCGLGYDSSNDDYKVVRASACAGAYDQIKVEVFSAKHNNWRLIQGFHESITILDDSGTYLNGALHWRASRGGLDTILALDMEKEEFFEVPQPETRDRNISFHSLGASQGCLSLLCYGYGLEVEIWVMKEYGVKSSWMKMSVVRGRDIGYCDYMVPICFTKNGEVIVVVDGMKLIRYNVHDKTMKNLKVRNDDWFEWVIYMESLVSPYVDSGNKDIDSQMEE